MKETGEKVLRIVYPNTGFSLRLADMVRMIVLIPIFGVSVFMISNYFTQELTLIFEPIIGVFFLIFSGYNLIYLLFIRRFKLRSISYIFFEYRFVIFNHQEKCEVHSFTYSDFPSIEFHENLNDFGYIIIGEKEPLIGKRVTPLYFGYGVNMADHPISIENIDKVRELYNFLTSLIEQAKQKQHELHHS